MKPNSMKAKKIYIPSIKYIGIYTNICLEPCHDLQILYKMSNKIIR